MASLTPLPAPVGAHVPPAARVAGSREARAWTQAGELESVFLNTMFGQMFSGLGQDTPLGGKHSEAWRGMLIDEYSKSVAGQGGIGLSSHIYRELIGAQEAAPRRLPPNGLDPYTLSSTRPPLNRTIAP